MPFAIGLDAAIALFKRWRWLILAAPVAGLIAYLWISLHGFLWWDGALGKLDKANATIAQMQLASEQARKAQIALNATNQDLSERIATHAAESHAENRPRIDSAIRDYADRNGLRKICEGSARRPDPQPVHPDPGAPVSPDADRELVAVPRDEFEALAQKAVRGDEATSFLIELVNEGLAVEWPEPAF